MTVIQSKQSQSQLVSEHSFEPPWFLRHGWSMTIYSAWQLERTPLFNSHPHSFTEHIFKGEQDVPIFGQVYRPSPSRERGDRPPTLHSQGTLIATYGITGNLDQQKSLHILRHKALERGLTIILIDWRAHGKTATLSPTLTSDGIYEGKDFIHIAAQAKALGCPPPYWFVGYSLGGQLALWSIHPKSLHLAETLELQGSEIGGAIAVCPNLDSNRSLPYLVSHPLGRWLEQSITQKLRKLAYIIHRHFPEHLHAEAIACIESIRQFDQELVVPRLGFASVEAYYDASSPLPWLSSIQKPALILYAEDDPMFHPGIPSDLEAIAKTNDNIHFWLTSYGGHVGYYSSREGQRLWGDRDPWWAWNRTLDWLNTHSGSHFEILRCGSCPEGGFHNGI